MGMDGPYEVVLMAALTVWPFEAVFMIFRDRGEWSIGDLLVAPFRVWNDYCLFQ